MKTIFRSKRWLALFLAAALSIGAIAVGLSMTYAESPVQERFKQPNAYALTVEKGRTETRISTGLTIVKSNDTSLATAALTSASFSVSGQKAGPVGIAIASKAITLNLPWQVTDSKLLSGYDLANNGEINKKAGDTPFSINASITGYVTPWNAIVDGEVGNPNYTNNADAAAAVADIEWTSRNPLVAEITKQGQVTIVSKGTAVMLGDFIDRWGVPRTITMLVGVDVIVGKTKLSDLEDWIRKAEVILNLEPNPYNESDLAALQVAKEAGEALLYQNPGDTQIDAAIAAIDNAIKALRFKDGIGSTIVIPPENGGPKKLRKTGTPKVYEVLDDETGQPTVPPTYIYDEDDSIGQEPPEWSGDETPAFPDGNLYYVETPEGSNIWEQINPDTGARTGVKKWGGADGRPGGNGADKDLPAYWDGAKWLAEDPEGSNLWKPVGNPKTTLDDNPANWVGGGSDGLPDGNNDLYPFSVVDGEVVAGPFQPDNYYIRRGPNGRFDTSGDGTGKPVGNAASGDDQKAYWDGSGWTNTPPVTGTAPSITSANSTSVVNGTGGTFQVTATGSAPITYSLSGAPSGVTINSTSGLIAIAGTVVVNSYNFTVTASNGVSPNATQSFTLTVNPDSSTSDYIITGFAANSGYLNSGSPGPNTALTAKIRVFDDLTGEETWETYSAATYGGTLSWALEPSGQPATLTGAWLRATAGAPLGTVITVKATLVLSGTTYTSTGSWIVVNSDGTIGGGAKDEPIGVKGRELPTSITKDTCSWWEIARTVVDGKSYSLILRDKAIQKSTFGSTNDYHSAGCTARNTINTWWANNDKIPMTSPLRQYTYLPNLPVGSWGTDDGGVPNNHHNGIDGSGYFATGWSSPKPGQQIACTNDTAFLLSEAEASKFCSMQFYNKGVSNYVGSCDVAQYNWGRLSDRTSAIWWLRSPYSTSYARLVNSSGSVYYNTVSGSCALRPALWVDSAIFNQ